MPGGLGRNVGLGGMERQPLSALLSQALIAFTLDFDRRFEANCKALGSKRSPPSLAMWSNILRFVSDHGVDQRKLPDLSGISKPAVQSSVACLERHGWVTVDAATKTVRLTSRGKKIAKLWRSTLQEVEDQWSASLRASLEKAVDKLEAPLPFYPVALPNRGGTPTGL